MKKVFLKVTIILIMILAMQCIQFKFNTVFAADTDEYGNPKGETSSSTGSSDTTGMVGEKSTSFYNPHPERNGTGNEFDSRVESILGAIRNVGIVVSVVALMAIGIKTMVLSVEEKAAYKQALPGYILGAIMVFVITWLPSLIYQLVQDANL